MFEDSDTFHGQYVATAVDFLAIAVTQLALPSERRLDMLINKFYSADLPEFLVNPKLPASLYAGFKGTRLPWRLSLGASVILSLSNPYPRTSVTETSYL